MPAFSHWLKRLSPARSHRTAKRSPAGRRPALRVEALEERLVPTLQLSYSGPGSDLGLSEISAGTDRVTVSEPVAGTLRIGLGSGTFSAGSSQAFGLSYENPFSPATSNFVHVDIGALNAVSTLGINLGGGSFDLLTLGLTNAAGGVGNVTVNDSVGSDTRIDLNSLTLQGGSLNVSGGPIRVISPATVSTHGGALTLSGVGTASTAGVDINRATVDAGASGTVRITGIGSTSAVFAAAGVLIQGGGIVTGSTTTVTGTAGAGGDFNVGVIVTGVGSRITSHGGAVRVIGQGGTSADGFNIGVTVSAGGVVTAGATGTVSVTGTGGAAGGHGNYGVHVVDPASRITSGGGAVQVNGTGGGTGTSANNVGVQVENGAQVTAGATGAVTVTGTGGAAGGNFNHGIWVVNAGSRITSGGGAVQVNGTGGGSGTSNSNHGVRVEGGGEVAAGDAGSVTVVGSGGAGRGVFRHGVLVTGAGSRIASAGGAVQVIGQGGGITVDGTNNVGVWVAFGGVVTAGGLGSVSVIGDGGLSGGSNYGVHVLGPGSSITSGGGAVQVTGAGGGTGGNNDGIRVANNAVVSSGGNGTLTLTGSGTLTAGSVGVRVADGGRITAAAGDATRNLGLAPGSAILVELSPDRDVSVYSFLDVEGTVDLGGASLQATAIGTIPSGTAFRLLNNDLADLVVGTFAQGSRLTVGGQTFALDYAGGTGNDVFATAVPQAGVTVTPTSGLNTTETGGTATFSVVLNHQPTADVSITFTSLDPTEGVVAATLTFSPANWNVPRTVTVTGVDDSLADGDVAYLVRGAAVSPDASYDGLPIADVALVNANDDAVVVESVRINDGSAQRSRVTSITITFNGDVTLAPGAITLARRDGSLVDLRLAMAVVGGRTVVTVTFVGPDIVAGSLADGRYRLTIDASKVHAGAETLGADQVVDLHRLFGDSDGDRDVDGLDALRFRNAMLGTYVAHFDYDGDGDVDGDDLAQFNLRRGTLLP